ncbi:carbohydrate ABC transporter permease [Limnochorda sp.]|uniref:carbohydrate ABC transporter permease n=1 Tax=Limnochorda sp. TaxID=1940279 RepID=UPI0039C4D307
MMRSAVARRRSAQWMAYAFLLPALAVYLTFVVGPILVSMYYSLFDWSGVSPRATYVGLQNFARLMGDRVFWKAVGNNLELMLLSILTQMPFALALALLITKGLRGMRFFRTAYFVPHMVPTVAIGILWIYIYDPTMGLLNNLLGELGLWRWQRGWLGEEATALYAVVGTMAWQFIPFYMILFQAALVGIPQELYEAASIDGATGTKAFRYITLPLLKGTIRTAVVLSLVGSLKYFDLIYIMTMGGPNHASELMATYMFKTAFNQFRMGYGSAVAVMSFLIAFVVSSTLLYFTQFRRED